MAKNSEKKNQKGRSTNRTDPMVSKAENTTRKAQGTGSQTHEGDAYTGRNQCDISGRK